MNEFERKYLDIIQNSSYYASVLRQNQQVVSMEYFSYNIRLGTIAVPIAAGAAAQGVIQIQADSDFALTYMSGDILTTTGAGLATNVPVTLQITDTGSGKTFFNEPTLFAMVTGRGGFPYFLPTPRIINPNTNIKFDVVNNTAVTLPGIFIAMQGARIYYE